MRCVWKRVTRARPEKERQDLMGHRPESERQHQSFFERIASLPGAVVRDATELNAASDSDLLPPEGIRYVCQLRDFLKAGGKNVAVAPEQADAYLLLSQATFALWGVPLDSGVVAVNHLLGHVIKRTGRFEHQLMGLKLSELVELVGPAAGGAGPGAEPAGVVQMVRRWQAGTLRVFPVGGR